MLTDLGYELSNLILNIDDYKESDSKSRSAIKEHFDVFDGFNVQTISTSQFHHRLTQRGWKTEDIDRYPTWLEEAFQLEYQTSIAIIDAIISRFSKIIPKCQNNALAKTILYNVILDAIKQCILVRFEGLLSERMYGETREQISKVTSYQLSDRTFAYFLNYAPPELKNRFIQNEAVEIVKSLYCILSPSKELLLWQFARQSEKDSKIKQQLDFLQSLDESKAKLKSHITRTH